MQTDNKTNKIVFCGDDRAKKSIYLENTRTS